MKSELLTCPTKFCDRRMCTDECCVEYNARLKERIATHGKCSGCKHWGTDKRRKTHQVCAALSKWDSPLEAIGDGCAECETDQPVQIETPAGFGCIKWEPRE